VASVVSMREVDAFCSAVRVTFVGSLTRGHGDVRGGSRHFRSGRAMPGSRQTGEMNGVRS